MRVGGDVEEWNILEKEGAKLKICNWKGKRYLALDISALLFLMKEAVAS